MRPLPTLELGLVILACYKLAGRYEVLLPLIFKFLLLLLFHKKNHETSKVSTVQPGQSVRCKLLTGPVSRVLV